MEIDYGKRHKLGQRAFILFLLRRTKIVVLLAIFSGGIWYGLKYVPPQYEFWATYIVQLILLMSGGFMMLILAQTYLEYRQYTYRFSDEAFIVTEGYIVQNEVAAVYHHIQSVNIKRTPLDRVTGVSQIVIVMTGPDRDSRRSQMVLPAVGKKKASLVQKELLVRARKHAMPHVVTEEKVSAS